jgi:endonuclease/exonuclease/phosphatase family metal-dependent hydrolase
MHRAIGVDRRFRPERIVRILKHHEADLVLLQEVDVGVPRSRMLDLAEEIANAAGYPYHAVGLNVTLRQGHYGNATLSRFPLSHRQNIDLTIGNRKKRGCLYTTVKLDDTYNGVRHVEVFNLHLGLSAQERVRQVGTLIHSPEFTGVNPTQPCIVGGDLNDWGTLLAPIFTDILDFECATNKSRGYHNAFHTYPSFSPAGGLDKIFYRGPLELIRRRRCWTRIARIASDHLPVIADFRIAKQEL